MTPKTENSNLHGFELHRPSSKGTKLLLQVIKAIINQFPPMEIGPKTQPVGCSLPQGLPPRALDAGFARGFLVLSIYLRKVCSSAPARWSGRYIRAHLRKVELEQTRRIVPRALRWARFFREGMWSLTPCVAQREKCRAARVFPQEACVM